MALPTTPPINLLAVGTEAGVSPPVSLASSAVRTLAGKTTGNINLLDLLGKSSRSYSVYGYFDQISGTLGRVSDRGTFWIIKSPSSAPVPTAYQWHYNDYGGMLMNGSLTGSTLQLDGPQHDGFGPYFSVDVWCEMTIEGVPYTTPVFTSSYQAGLL